MTKTTHPLRRKGMPAMVAAALRWDCQVVLLANGKPMSWARQDADAANVMLVRSA